ncbi:MAG: antibiotic ABC transporter ATP-binding protein [Bacteroidetes bacterium GWE2_41_25]|nr:MAG: antibiotic ABC transporter ATP-binding protein [Bacteroidetes bacterium GWA2_40_15]OFY00501.1 MAG: antibiotic ABC transporter ATP-binding protein [Bacteroidetes bacterium GWC2_40_22]OFY11946.1 MAG: antibiotic ABC transporter ATP-binding protein [Bacteroidetes bacterium GWE2_41_25]HAM10241.1 antibiotic ABC transporter ATP-binding protein [Bacteroidales bacterium]HBH82542.1 antibiotic ABC transporter ATP-binding protein [Bacteroidales bacterium]
MKNIRLLLKYFAPYRWSAFRSILYNILGGLFALLSFSLVVPFLTILFNNLGDVANPGEFQLTSVYIQQFSRYYLSIFIEANGKSGALMLVVFIVIGASLFKNTFIFLANNSIAYIRACTVRDLRKRLYDKFLKLPISFFTDTRKGDVMTRMSNDVQEVEISVIASLTMLFRDPMYIIIFVVYLFVSNYQLTLFAMVLLPLSGWLIGRASRTLRSSSLIGQENLGRLLTVVEETLTGLRIVKVFNAEVKMKKQFASANERYSKVFKRVTRKYFLASPLSEFLSTIVIMMLLYAGGSMALKGTGTMSPEQLIAYLVIFSQIIQPAKNITTAYFSIQKGMASIQRIDEIIDAEEKIIEKENAVSVDGFNDSIEFRGVWYGYNSEPVLKEINLKIKKGQTIAIVGKSGAGKSTLADLLPRLIDVDQGNVLVDGIDVRDMKLKELRNLMGFVSQQPILFNTSFTENIAFSMDVADKDAVESAARIANAHDFIMDTESGYETPVGESGNKLSGGQRQRISIARAIMANPPILILDEATSALDTESERLVQDAILNLMKNRTSVVIAHRLSTIQHADLIVVMDEGRIVETGSHDELMNRQDGFYRKLHSYQAI